MDMPPDLRAALAAELGAMTPKALAGCASDLSARYRGAEDESGAPFVRSAGDVAAYAAYRLPATFAAVYAALAALRAAVPELRPSSLLDAGAGPGPAAWAAAEIWPELERATLLEREAGMIALGRRLARHAGARAVREATWRRVDIAADPWEAEQSDLVVAAYVLGEVPAPERDALVARLWDHAAGAVVIVDPGTPRGFAAVRRARAQLIDAGATVAAPCPHERDCPMPEGDWCHFAQRVGRTALHREVKSAALSYEDEKYSYVAATRLAVPARRSRVLRHPQTRKGLVILELCTPEGLRCRTVSRRDGAIYRQARDATWGTALEPGPTE